MYTSDDIRKAIDLCEVEKSDMVVNSEEWNRAIKEFNRKWQL